MKQTSRGNPIHSLWRYLKGHWNGEHGLAWSFWINLVLLRLVVFALQDWLGPQEGHDFRDSRLLIMLLALVFHGGLFVWQAVGVIRASESCCRTSGWMAPVWGTQLVTGIGFIWVMIYLLEAWQMTLETPDPLRIQAALEAERAAAYSIQPSSDGRTLTLTGSLELGITRRLSEQLEAYPSVDRIVLDSPGGNIFEARGLSRTIRQNGLNTLVFSECSSACTTVFIGGAERRLAPGARLGFHQYRVDADYAVLHANPAREQDRDRAVFHQSGVSPWFLDKMFEHRASGMWYPQISELIDARVVTGLTPRPGGN